MRLEDVLEQLDSLNKELAKAQKAQVTIDVQAQKLSKRYQTSAKNIQQQVKYFEKVLPPILFKRFDNMVSKMNEGAQLAMKTRDLHSQYQQSIIKTANEWQRLNEAAAVYSAQFGNASEKQRVDATKLSKMYEDMMESRERGEFDLAATIHRVMLRKMDTELKSGKTLFQSWMTMERTATSASQLQSTTSSILKKYEESNSALAKLSRQTGGLVGMSEKVVAAFGKVAKPVGIAIAAVTSLKLLLLNSFSAINQSLIEANSELGERYKLVKANYFVGLQLGASSEQIANAQKALLVTGQKQLAMDKSHVKTITMLNVGLGISEESAAQLSLFSKLTGNNFKEVGDAIAVVVNGTQLTASEALNLADTMAKVQRSLGLVGNTIPEIVTSLGVMESELKSFGADNGSVARLVSRFSSLKGIGDAIILGGSQGIISPKDFQDTDKMMGMIQHTGQQLKDMIGDEDSAGYAVRLSSIASAFHLTTQDAQALMKASEPEEFARKMKEAKELNKVLASTNALEKRYREQQTAAGKQWDMMKKQGMALVGLALTPLLKVMTWLMTGVNKILGGFLNLVNWIESGSDALDTATSWWKGVFKPATDIVASGMRMVGDTLKWLATPLTWAYIQLKKIASVFKPLSSTFAAPVYLAVKAFSFLASVVIGGLLIRSLFMATKSMFGFGRMAFRLAGELGGPRVVGMLRGLVNFGGIGTRATTLTGVWRAVSTGLGRFFTGIGPSMGRMLGSIATKVPWGPIASRVALPIAAAVGAFKIGQLGVEAYKLHKAKKSEKEDALLLKTQQDRIRQKYNIPAGVDVNKWLHQQVESKSAEMHTVSAIAPTSSTPYQRRVLPMTRLPQAGANVRTRESEMADHHFAKLTGEVKQLQSVIKTGAEKQVKVVEKGNNMEFSLDRLHRENEALRSKPVTTYGLEMYVS